MTPRIPTPAGQSDARSRDVPQPRNRPSGVALREFYDDRELPAAERRGRHGDAFLVVSPEALSAPVGSQSTLPALPGVAPAPRRDTLAGPESPGEYRVLTIRRRGLAVSPHVTVGRTPNNDVVLLDTSVSKFHAILIQEGEELAVLDAGSHNGTSVDDVPVPTRGQGKPVPLGSGARLRFGSVDLLYLRWRDFWRFVEGMAAPAAP